MNRADKQFFEKQVCDHFLDALADDRFKLIYQPKPPLPDIVLKNTDTNAQIGLEITRSIQPPKEGQETNLFEQMGRQKKLLKRAAELFYKQYSYKVYCNVNFKNLRLKFHEFDVYLKPLLEIIHIEIQRRENNSMSLTFSMRSEEDDLPDMISYIRVIKNSQEIGLNWGVSGMHDWPPNLSLEDIQRIVSKKESSLQKYTSQFTENWLLIHEAELGTWFENKQVFEGLSIETNFHRVFFLDLGLKLYEMNVKTSPV